MIPGLVALLFSRQALQDTGAQLQITGQSQVSGQFNTAVSDLASAALSERLGGIYILQGIMRAAPGRQPVVINILSSFIREHAPAPAAPPPWSATPPAPAVDVQAALTVLADRDPSNDHGTILNLSNADLASADLESAQLANADLEGTDLANANLISANLTGIDQQVPAPDLDPEDGPDFSGAGLADANLAGADVEGADFSEADLMGTDFESVNAGYADFTRAVFSGASAVVTNMAGAGLSFGKFTGTCLEGVNLTGAVLDGATGISRTDC